MNPRRAVLLLFVATLAGCARAAERPHARASPPDAALVRPVASASPSTTLPAGSAPAIVMPGAAASAHGNPTGNDGVPAVRLGGGGGARAVSGAHGLVVSVEAHATRAGVEILEAGGSAVDAAVATAAALAVTYPSAGNLGGGGFLLVRPPAGPSTALDFRETAPASLTRPDFDRMIANKAVGPAAPGVPGSVRGLVLAHRRFGRLPLARVLQPAISLARSGYPLGPQAARLIARAWPALRVDAAARGVFGVRGQPKPAGTRMVQPELATTLEAIAARGDTAFYEGPIAEAIGRATGGRVSAADLAGYRAVFREPLRFRYHGFDVETMPPPSTGGLVLAGMLAALDSLGAHQLAPDSPAELHAFIEVGRRAQALRRFRVRDPDTLSPADGARLLEDFTQPGRLLGIPVDPARQTPSSAIHPLYPAALRELEHTTHLSVADANGMVVALTTTLSASFGARIVAPGTGVVLGNAVASFSSAGDNQPSPGRRTTSSMAPTLVLAQGRPVLVLGTPGGDTIPSTLTLLVRRLIDRGMPLDQAIDAPRLHHGFVPDAVRYEAGRPFPKPVLAELRTRGHVLRPLWSAQGDANCLLVAPDRVFGYADPREAGTALAARPAATTAN